MQGVIVGCDRNQEWLLSWWWDHYSKHNSYPVAFFDFGMSQQAANWCRQRGRCIELGADCPLKTLSPTRKKSWEKRAGPIWPFRSAWFKKPFAFLSCPFDLGCWIDLDCEIKGPLDPLFNCLAFGTEIALVREPENVQQNDLAHKLILPGEITYNSGVIAFRRGAGILSHWAELSLHSNDRFMSDQNALSRAIFLRRPQLLELPAIYNWKKDQPINPQAVILHYVSSSKVEILKTLSH